MYAVHNIQVSSKQVTVPVFVPRNNPTADNGVNSRRESVSTEKSNLSMVRKLTDIRNPTGSKYQTAKLTIGAESEPLRRMTNCVVNSAVPNFHFSLFTKQEASEVSGDTHVSINSVAENFGKTMSPDVPLSSSRKILNNVWKSTTPEEVLSIFLVDLRVMAELQLKRAVRNVVLTIPVSFSRFQLTRIERACAMAELFVVRLIPEPTAVALLYGQHQQQTVHDSMGSGSKNIAMIFNMGDGYYDVCVSATTGGVSRSKPCQVVTLEERYCSEHNASSLAQYGQSFLEPC
ncbi:hypothetical protein GIB67_028798 [Kingdonia uniflora]|uniref:Uncharacterized protein n=1 Tax=Kingdonia uniflora TaxID=39325 RepID=A0A7J7LBM9_9MAGN|nr:hypothetical protein GIB67_028798 [Kingdonia uniflora]